MTFWSPASAAPRAYAFRDEMQADIHAKSFSLAMMKAGTLLRICLGLAP
jgi:hypothetical protein